MRLGLAIQGDLEIILRAERTIVSKSVTKSIRRAGTNAKNELRRITRRAGLGMGVEKAWQTLDYPKGRGKHSMGATSLVFSKATRIVSAFAKDRTVRPKRAQALLFATDEGESLGLATAPQKSRGHKPRKVFNIEEAREKYGPLWTVQLSGSQLALLFGTVAGFKTPLAFITTDVRLQRVYDVGRVAQKWKPRIPGQIVREIERAERPKPQQLKVVF